MTAVGETHYASAYGRVIAIETNGVPLPLPYLPFPWSMHAPAGEIDRHYRIWVNDDGHFALEYDDVGPLAIVTTQLLNEHIESDLHHWLATYTRGYLFVHAGCVSWRNRGIVIPGRSYAGKTTLTRALVEAGATYYSDDYAVIDHEGMIWPFPRRLHVRPITADPPHKIDPHAENWAIGATPMQALIVAELRFDHERGWDIEELPQGHGAISLLDNTVAARERPHDSLHLMAKVMRDAIVIKGTRDSAEVAAQRLLAMANTLLSLD